MSSRGKYYYLPDISPIASLEAKSIICHGRFTLNVVSTLLPAGNNG